MLSAFLHWQQSLSLLHFTRTDQARGHFEFQFSAMMLWFLFGLLCLSQGSMMERLSREELLSWFRHKVLDGLGVEEAPVVRGPHEERRYLGRRMPKKSRTDWVDQRDSKARPDVTQVILFPSPETACPIDSPHLHHSVFSYIFQPSINQHQSVVTSAQLWFFSGLGLPENSSAPVFMLTSGQQHLLASPGPSTRSRDGWSTLVSVRVGSATAPLAGETRGLSKRAHRDSF